MTRYLIPAIFLMLSAFPSLAAESVKFAFNPPTPLSFKETLKTTRSDVGPEAPSRETVIIERRWIDLVKTETGYEMTVRPDSIRQLRNRREIKLPRNPLEELVQEGVFTYTLDENGALQSVSGQEEVLQRLQAVVTGLLDEVPAERRSQFAASAFAVSEMLEAEALLSRMQSDWGTRVSDLVGAEMAVGESRAFESEVSLPEEQSVHFAREIRLDSLVPCGDGECARLTYNYETQAAALEDTTGDALDDLTPDTPSDAAVTGTGERVIDPSTMLIQSETDTRTIAMELPGPDGTTIKGTRTEIREYTYEYPDSGTGE